MNTIVKRQQKEKQTVVDNLKHLPIIEVACSKAGIARATYYRWKSSDNKFAKLADEAISNGVGYINDLAESKLLSEINNGNLTSIMYWLNHRHNAYNNRVEITASIKQSQSLTIEQKDAVKKALSLTGFIETSTKKGEK